MGGGPESGNTSDYPQCNFSPGAKWIKGLTNDRIGNFTGGHFADVNLSSVLFTDRLDDSKHIQLQRWSAPGHTKPSFEEALKQHFEPAKKGESIGPSCECATLVVSPSVSTFSNRGKFYIFSVIVVTL